MWRVVYQGWQYGTALLKIFFIFSLICFLPQFFMSREKKQHSSPSIVGEGADFKLGVQSLCQNYVRNLLPNNSARVALITNDAATAYAGAKSELLLADKGIIVDAVFTLADSDYHHMTALLQACKEYAVVLVDLQDTGYGTPDIIQAMVRMAQELSSLHIVVLDRPNVLGPKIEGVSTAPLRTGMTIGELTRYYLAHTTQSCAIEVIAMQQYDRRSCAGHQQYITDMQQKMYGSLLCALLAEVMPLDVGNATDLAQRVIALPDSLSFGKKNWYELQVQLREVAINSTLCSYYSPIKNSYCTGLKLYIQDMAEVDGLHAVLMVLSFFKQRGLALGFTKRFDDLVGSPLVRNYLEGTISKAALKEAINSDMEQFYRQAFNAFLYHPLPQVVLV